LSRFRRSFQSPDQADLGVEPNVAFEVRPAVDRVRIGRCRGRHISRSVLGTPARSGHAEYIVLDEPEICSPIIMSYRINDRSPLLAHFLKLIDEFDQWCMPYIGTNL
jgi:hypothetical protein